MICEDANGIIIVHQVGNSGNRMTGSTHHLPKTVAEMATAEKFLDFQGNFVPCKTRAKRGFATHPRSIAERVCPYSQLVDCHETLAFPCCLGSQ